MTLINFVIKGVCVEEQTVTSSFSGKSLTLGELKALFPFEGVFHFRQKVEARALQLSGDYVWLDLCRDQDSLSMAGDSIDIAAVALSLPDAPAAGASYEEYYTGLAAELTNNGMAPRDRPMRKQPNVINSRNDRSAGGGSGSSDAAAAAHYAKNISVESVTKAASSIWSSVVSTATTLHNQVASQSTTIPPESRKILDFMRTELTTTFDESLPPHLIRIQDLWETIFPGEDFQRQSPKWRLVGFQNADPIVDLKNGGILPLLNMSYFCQQYSTQAQSMIAAQKENKKSNYPFAIVCVNITLLLADLLGLRDQRYYSICIYESYMQA
jgi:hypothetical protein